MKTSGTLIYCMGASGCGKDSILSTCMKQYAKDSVLEHVIIAERYITRNAQDNAEKFISLTKEDFISSIDKNFFALHWESHCYYYGICADIINYLEKGKIVIVNGSREYLPTAQKKFPSMIPVLIKADANALRERLIKRGRESIAEIEKRIERASMKIQHEENMLTIDNSYSLEASVEQFYQIIQTQHNNHISNLQ